MKHHDPVKKAQRAIVRRENSAAKLKPKPELLRTRKKQILGELSDDLEKTDHPNATFIRESENAAINSATTGSNSSSFTTPKRVPLTLEQKHIVFHRDQGRCTHVDVNGKRCNSDRWVDVHHVVEVSRGGTNEPSNLTLLCSFHHDLVHQLSLEIEGQFNWIREPRSKYS